MPEGIWCSTNSPAPVFTVWPAFAPPWYRTTRSALSASTSTIFPFPSSPHCAPTTTTQCRLGPNISPPAKRKAPGGTPGHPLTEPTYLAAPLQRSLPAHQSYLTEHVREPRPVAV